MGFSPPLHAMEGGLGGEVCHAGRRGGLRWSNRWSMTRQGWLPRSGSSHLRSAVASFPGSNGDMDAVSAVSAALGTAAERIWRTETDLSRFDAVVLPGGFSYGD